MNSALEAPVEALALDYLGLGFLTAINNIWAWVAVMAGAVSFLVTIRKPTLSVTAAVLPDPEVRNPNPVPEPDQSFYPPATSAEAPGEAVDWTTRRKFTVVYYEDDLAAATEEYDVDVADRDRANRTTMSQAQDWNQLNELSSSRGKFGSARLDYFPSEWEWDAMLRMGNLTGYEMGWYRCQDLTALNGNIVRLWDSGRD